MEAEKNRFFIKALRQAAEVIRNNKRLSTLLNSVASKTRNANLGNGTGLRFIERIKVMGRMVKSYARGSYREVSWKSILIIVGALIYFVTPLDLIPDFIPVTGLLDDFTVIIWVYRNLQTEIDRFVEWENQVAVNN